MHSSSAARNHARPRHCRSRYLEHCKKYNKDTTIEDKARTLKAFKDHAGNPWLKQVNKKTVQDFLDSRMSARSGKAISAERYNSERQILNNFFNYLIAENVFKENPCKGIEQKKIVINKAKQSLSPVQEMMLDKYLAAGDDKDEATKRKHLSAELKGELGRVKAVAINTGLRARELANLTWPDVDFENATLRVSPNRIGSRRITKSGRFL
jgi:site-specific recombinase XerD